MENRNEVSDVVIVGSGVNSLVCGALLAKQGRRVHLLERNATLGGAIRTEEITLPGFRHDLMSCWYPLFVTSPAYQELKTDLARHGLEFCQSTAHSAVLTGTGACFVLTSDRRTTIRSLELLALGDGKRFQADMESLQPDLKLIFGLLGGDLWSKSVVKLILLETMLRGMTGATAFFGDAIRTCRQWLADYSSPVSQAMFAPWVLHSGMGPDAAMSGLIGRLIAFTLEAAGCPVVKGGSGNLTAAFERLLIEHGAEIVTSANVTKLLLSGNRVTGVRTEDHRSFHAPVVICNVTPDRLYCGMLPATAVPAKFKMRAQRYRYGRAGMQIHLALDRPAQWANPDLNDVAIVHVCDGIDGIATAIRESEAGYLPRRATIVVGQPARIDPSRVPDGKGQLWIQLLELPSFVKGDAGGNIARDNAWTDEIGYAYAERIIDRLEMHIPGLAQSILKQVVLTPSDLERLNCNLVGGDPYSGDCSLDQFGLWRPFPGVKGHRTPIKGLWHIGASTHPGPGLGAGSGFAVAKAIGKSSLAANLDPLAALSRLKKRFAQL